MYAESDDVQFTFLNTDAQWRPLDCPDRYRAFAFGASGSIYLADMLPGEGGKRGIVLRGGSLVPGEYSLKLQLKAYVVNGTTARCSRLPPFPSFQLGPYRSAMETYDHCGDDPKEENFSLFFLS